MKALVQFVDLVGKEPTDRGAEDPRELGVQEMTHRAFEGLATAGVVGIPDW
jgi:hypothetical protein